MGDSTLSSQFSTNSKTEMVPNGGVDGVQVNTTVHGTTIPLREQFRCKRFWFFHHDLRAFTTSWLPLPVFIGYRIFLFSYLLIWLILHAESRHPMLGPFWLTQITNLAYILLNIAELSLLILCSVYAIVYCVKRQILSKYIPNNEFSHTKYYSQDNIPWYVKLVWILYVTATTMSVMVVIGYWTLVYGRCAIDDPSPEGNVTIGSNTTTAPAVMSTMTSTSCNILDAQNFHVHLINAIFVIVDIFMSRMPYQILHFFYPCVFMGCYSLFTIFYWVGGGTDPNGDRFIYSVLDYSESPQFAFTLAFFLTFPPMLFFLILCLLALLRDFIYSRISFCYKDIKESPFEYEMGHQLSENGVSETKGSTL